MSLDPLCNVRIFFHAVVDLAQMAAFGTIKHEGIEYNESNLELESDSKVTIKIKEDHNRNNKNSRFHLLEII